ncbi:tetratricopeptide repeat protein [Hymenobacter busanensis]|uniref:Regulator of microtubule dynamics protein 1 n=1 Tax=Hymenobacter busanensis TaxID=2607656 RepID=A0A7L4ZTX9_9BACT|nr:tetratricopeptide repeat protein [Hymenobacter busanensis]KAA9339809.1 tetratricopeptide repeat protein [Hymenobacter busanensis]QHJ06437.1 hypothetical protein GUY19_03635 [Hymenobacter busanensis]
MFRSLRSCAATVSRLLVGLALLLALDCRADDGDEPKTRVAEVSRLMAEARALQKQYRESAALARYELVLAQQPRYYEALWRAAVLSTSIGMRYTDESRRTAYFTSARQYADRAYAVNPKGGEANYAVAFTLAQRATLLNAPQRIRLYKEMKPYAWRAVEYSPNLPDAWQMLGRWHYRVAHFNVVERAYCRLFLGGRPAGASNTRAMEALRKAHELDPRRIQFCYDLARVYANQHLTDEAMQVLEQAAALPTVTSEDLETNRKCLKLLGQVRRSCGMKGEVCAAVRP